MRTHPTATPQETVRVPMVQQRWRDVAFLHWAYPPAVVQALLPPGLHVDTFDGMAWVGLTPFVVEDARPTLLPAVPFVGRYPESNLRTYAVGPDGRDGLWFLSIEAGSLPTSAAARLALNVPYHWSAMVVRRHHQRVQFVSARHGADHLGHRTSVRFDGPLRPARDRLAEWLTGRWRAWIRTAGSRLATVAVEHEPWPLIDATVIDHQDTLLTAAGLPTPPGAPITFASPGVSARLGWPRPVPVHRTRVRTMGNRARQFGDAPSALPTSPEGVA